MVGAGYAVSAIAAGPVFGWFAALLGVVLTCVDLLGPGTWPVHPWVELTASKHRMAAMTGVCVACAVLPHGFCPPLLLLALGVVGGACALALWVRASKR
jgi:hypothetical protein